MAQGTAAAAQAHLFEPHDSDSDHDMEASEDSSVRPAAEWWVTESLTVGLTDKTARYGLFSCLCSQKFWARIAQHMLHWQSQVESS